MDWHTPFMCLVVIGTLARVASEPVKPNIVFILADDLGWDDVSFHGSRQIPTPNLDALAYDGVILSNYYVQPICTPTRSALLTGRHPIHTGLQVDTISGAAPYALGLNETILPQYLKTMDYKTHIVGKWHLGFYAEQFTPTRRGFDSHYGYLTGKEDYWDHTDQEGSSPMTWGLDFRRDMELVKDAYGQYSTHLFTTEAERIIDEHDSARPLFMYFAHQGVHAGNKWKPLEAPWSYYSCMSHIRDSQRRMFAAMVSVVDESVGNLTKALHKKGLLNNTIIVFSTDNGGPAAGFDHNAASNAPLRGMKHTLWEGGVRGTGFIWSPLLQNTGIVNDQMIQVHDWLPTLLNPAGYNMSTLPSNLDGIDQWDVLARQTRTLRTEMLHNIDSAAGEYALRVNDHKLIYSRHGSTRAMQDWYSTSHVGNQSDHHIEIDPSNQRVDYIETAFEACNNSQSIDETNYVLNSDSARSRSSVVYDDEKAPADMFKSDLDRILKVLGRTGPKGSPLVINCGTKPANASTNCDIATAPCLYNIRLDPCEYHNLAPQDPVYVKQLVSRMMMYNLTAVPPKNKPNDPRAFPGNNGGVWGPWIKLDL